MKKLFLILIMLALSGGALAGVGGGRVAVAAYPKQGALPTIAIGAGPDWDSNATIVGASSSNFKISTGNGDVAGVRRITMPTVAGVTFWDCEIKGSIEGAAVVQSLSSATEIRLTISDVNGAIYLFKCGGY